MFLFMFVISEAIIYPEDVHCIRVVVMEMFENSHFDFVWPSLR